MPPHPVDVAVALFAAHQDGNFSVAQAKDVGATRSLIHRRTSAGRWLVHGPAVIGLPGFPETPRCRLWQALLDAGPVAMASHGSAAALHRLDGFHLGEPEILVPHGAHHRNAAGTVHQTRRMPLPVTAGGIPATPLVRTLLDLAPRLGPVRLGRVLDEVVVRGDASLPAIERGLEWMERTRRAGAVNLARALDGRTRGYVPSRSELERLLDAVLATLPFPAPEHEVTLPNRALEPHRVDRLFRHPPLIVEADGRLWHARLQDLERDRRRDRHALRLGFPTVRYGWTDLTRDAHEVREELLDLLQPRPGFAVGRSA